MPASSVPTAYRAMENNWELSGEGTTLAYYAVGGCEIYVETAGPAWLAARNEKTMDLNPMQIRSAAEYLINNCVGHPDNIGGFLTQDLSHMLAYLGTPALHNLEANDASFLHPVLYPRESTFITIAVASDHFGNIVMERPGDSHPATGSVISTRLLDKWLNAREETDAATYFERAWRKIFAATARTGRGDQFTWWYNP
ncbi:hypothetical protein MMC13_003755 [Lambiella insularis]|nr:hypothetical protein [Lambiella insularis]